MTKIVSRYLTKKDLHALACYKFGQEKVKSVTKVGTNSKSKNRYLITLVNGELIYMSRQDMLDIVNEVITIYQLANNK